MNEGAVTEPGAGSAATEPAADLPTRIAGPLPCVKCLYDLGGLVSDQKCPECGTEIQDSIEAASTDSVVNRASFSQGLRSAALAMLAGPLVFACCGLIAIAIVSAHSITVGSALRAVGAGFVLIPTAYFPWISARGWQLVARASVLSRREQRGMLCRAACVFALLTPLTVVMAVVVSCTTTGSAANKVLLLIAWSLGLFALVIWVFRTLLGIRIVIEALKRASLFLLALFGSGVLIVQVMSSACLLVSVALLFSGSQALIDVMGVFSLIGVAGIQLSLLTGGAWLLLARQGLLRSWSEHEPGES